MSNPLRTININNKLITQSPFDSNDWNDFASQCRLVSVSSELLTLCGHRTLVQGTRFMILLLLVLFFGILYVKKLLEFHCYETINIMEAKINS